MSLLIIVRRVQRDPLPMSDYEVEVKVTTSPTNLQQIAAPVRVTGHRRDDGYAMLLARYLQQHHPAALRKVMSEDERPAKG